MVIRIDLITTCEGHQCLCEWVIILLAWCSFLIVQLQAWAPTIHMALSALMFMQHGYSFATSTSYDRDVLVAIVNNGSTNLALYKCNPFVIYPAVHIKNLS